jgi:hypothetical protein
MGIDAPLAAWSPDDVMAAYDEALRAEPGDPAWIAELEAELECWREMGEHALRAAGYR